MEFSGGVATHITILGGTSTVEGAAPGMGFEAARASLTAAGDDVALDTTTEEVFGVDIGSVTRDGVTVYGLEVDPGSSTVTAISTPSVLVCE